MDEDSQQNNSKTPGGHSGNAGVSHAGAVADTFEALSVFREQDVFFQIRKPRRVHWAIAWSDLMMTMFILFAVMFIYQSANREFQYGGKERSTTKQPAAGKTRAVSKEEPKPDHQSELISRVERIQRPEQPMEIFRLKMMQDLERVKLKEDQAVRIILPSDLLFDMGRADLKTQAVSSLREIAAAVKNTSDVINVVGHTDNVPIHSEQFATNWELSAIRACRVARFLIEEMQVPAERVFVSGYSYFQPLKPNDTIENRSENRRVEIILSKKKPLTEKR